MRGLLWFCLLGGCSYHVFSPPGRVMPVESIVPVGAGHVAVGLEGSLQGGGAPGDTPFDVAGGAARVRYGVSDKVEVAGEVAYANVISPSKSGVDPSLFMARAGVTYIESNAAVFVGAGGGSSAGGSYAALDAGFVVGARTCHVVPFFSGRLGTSVPIDAQPVDLTAPGDSTQHVSTPSVSYQLGVQFGLEVLLRETCATRPRASLFLATGAFMLLDDEKSALFEGIGLGAQLRF